MWFQSSGTRLHSVYNIFKHSSTTKTQLDHNTFSAICERIWNQPTNHMKMQEMLTHVKKRWERSKREGRVLWGGNSSGWWKRTLFCTRTSSTADLPLNSRASKIYNQNTTTSSTNANCKYNDDRKHCFAPDPQFPCEHSASACRTARRQSHTQRVEKLQKHSHANTNNKCRTNTKTNAEQKKNMFCETVLMSEPLPKSCTVHLLKRYKQKYDKKHSNTFDIHTFK